MHVAWMGTIGVRCMFGTDVKEEVPEDFVWTKTVATAPAEARIEGSSTVSRRLIGRGSATR